MYSTHQSGEMYTVQYTAVRRHVECTVNSSQEKCTLYSTQLSGDMYSVQYTDVRRHVQFMLETQVVQPHMEPAVH